MKMFGLILSMMMIVFSVQAQNKVVYGDDDRVNPADASSMMRERALSTAGMFDSFSLKTIDDNVVISGYTLESKGVCSTAKFSQQITAAVCSGFLVGEDLLVTAGHCIKYRSDCARYLWVFDFVDNSNGEKTITVKKSSVYECKKILSRSLSNWTKNDFALIRLNRKVTDRPVLKVRTEGKIADGQEVTVIGHPTGIPTKIAGGAFVRDNSESKFFETNLDTFGGNSGSAVFNSETGIVEGILVRGEKDYISVGGCDVPNHCSMTECSGEDVTRITNIKKLMRML